MLRPRNFDIQKQDSEIAAAQVLNIIAEGDICTGFVNSINRHII